MNFEPDDLDWALGELIALIWRGKFGRIPAHLLEPELFYACMHVVNEQPAEVRIRVRDNLRKIEPMKVNCVRFTPYEVPRTA